MLLRASTIMIMLAIIIISFLWISYIIMDMIGIDTKQDLESSLYLVYDNNLNISTYDFSKLFIYDDNKYCNNNNKDRYRSAVVGGLYNTGTNALLTLLRQNCFGLKTKRMPSKAVRYYKSIFTVKVDRKYCSY